MPTTATLERPTGATLCCRHCGEDCGAAPVVSRLGAFCCVGCEAVFELLSAHDLTRYYDEPGGAGVSQRGRPAAAANGIFALDDPGIVARFVRFGADGRAAATFAVPSVHCASCVWLLEQFWRFEPGVGATEVDLQRRTVRIDFDPARTSARRIAERLTSLGYEPVIDAERMTGALPAASRRLYLQVGVAGFAFGNMMLFSVPRYANGAPVEGGFQALFDGLNLLLALPVLLFSASGFFTRAWHGVRARTLTIELPIVIGLVTLVVRSLADIVTRRGPGFLDSFAGLVFFLLIGRLFQQKAFDSLAFDRSFRSFLPLSVTVENGSVSEVAPVDRLRVGDRIRLRRGEVVPADARLLDADGDVDYRFLTGEETPVAVHAGDVVRAGGRAVTAMRLSVMREVSESELASLWANPVFARAKRRWLTAVASRFGVWFTALALVLAAAGALFWWPDAAASINVATAVLIVACPCALTLAAPITFGTAMGLLGRRGLYLKDPGVVLDLSRVDTVIFDKTGTLTSASGLTVLDVTGLSDRAWRLVRRLARESSHPVSVAIATSGTDLEAMDGLCRPDQYREFAGDGVIGVVDGELVAIGRPAFVERVTGHRLDASGVTAVTAGAELGAVRIGAAPRPGIDLAAHALGSRFRLLLVSGDEGTEWARWARLFGNRLFFRRSPEEKLAIVSGEQDAGRHVLMVGDGLNDAGALAASDVGLAVCDDNACVVPACDGVIGGDRLASLPAILRFARRARHTVLVCFAVSIAYNALGLTFALSGALTPLASAILMPVSSLTIVGLSAGGMRWAARRMLPP
jgi:Cu+-exporting ATPase